MGPHEHCHVAVLDVEVVVEWDCDDWIDLFGSERLDHAL